MMRRTFVYSAALSLAAAAPTASLVAQGGNQQVVVTPIRSEEPFVLYSADQLDNLLATVALYPDPLLAQVLLAATFPDEIESAARWVRANGANGIDDQQWDVSVKAVAHYPTVLNLMADRIDWTTSVGQAYAGQSTDVMSSVQRLRAMANAQGNLVSTPQQQVLVNDGYYSIVPAEPRVIYVPSYDPTVIYFQRVYYRGGFGGFWSFGVGFPIGSWLAYDCDWYGRRIYYDGWSGGGWRVRALPYVVFNTVYVNPRFANVRYNHDVIYRQVNYSSINRFRPVHRETNFDNHIRGGGSYRPSGPVGGVDHRNSGGDPRNGGNRGGERTGNGGGTNENPRQAHYIGGGSGSPRGNENPAPRAEARPFRPSEPNMPRGNGGERRGRPEQTPPVRERTMSPSTSTPRFVPQPAERRELRQPDPAGQPQPAQHREIRPAAPSYQPQPAQRREIRQSAPSYQPQPAERREFRQSAPAYQPQPAERREFRQSAPAYTPQRAAPSAPQPQMQPRTASPRVENQPRSGGGGGNGGGGGGGERRGHGRP